MGVNSMGLDVSYFRKKLKMVLADLEYYSPEEMERELLKYAAVASPVPGSDQAGRIYLNGCWVVPPIKDCAPGVDDVIYCSLASVVMAFKYESEPLPLGWHKDQEEAQDYWKAFFK